MEARCARFNYPHPVFHTLCRPNGADFAPEFLCDKVRVRAEVILKWGSQLINRKNNIINNPDSHQIHINFSQGI